MAFPGKNMVVFACGHLKWNWKAGCIPLKSVRERTRVERASLGSLSLFGDVMKGRKRGSGCWKGGTGTTSCSSKGLKDSFPHSSAMYHELFIIIAAFAGVVVNVGGFVVISAKQRRLRSQVRQRKIFLSLSYPVFDPRRPRPERCFTTC